ncbi:hypothetical protein FOA52_005430 [Chlamydomonas sp. UWO 241]|nr:hypothetical protein FOA52_005430 [Chlamydomonas sp. UWO 241]
MDAGPSGGGWRADYVVLEPLPVKANRPVRSVLQLKCGLLIDSMCNDKSNGIPPSQRSVDLGGAVQHEIAAGLNQLRQVETDGYTMFSVGRLTALDHRLDIIEAFMESPDANDRGLVKAVFRTKTDDRIDFGGKQLRQVVVPVPQGMDDVELYESAGRVLDKEAVDLLRKHAPADVLEAIDCVSRAVIACIPGHLRKPHLVAGCALLGNFDPDDGSILVNQQMHTDHRLVPYVSAPPVFLVALREGFNIVLLPKSGDLLRDLANAADMIGAYVGDVAGDMAGDMADMADVIVTAIYREQPDLLADMRAVTVRVEVGQGIMISGNTVHCSHKPEVADGKVVKAMRAHVYAQKATAEYPQDDDATWFLDNLAPRLESSSVAGLLK